MEAYAVHAVYSVYTHIGAELHVMPHQKTDWAELRYSIYWQFKSE